MSAASSERPKTHFDISVFMMLHGNIFLFEESGNESVTLPVTEQESTKTKTNNYRLKALRLPLNTKLYAPCILGYTYSYYQLYKFNLHTFIHGIHKVYIEHAIQEEYIPYLLSQINNYEPFVESLYQTQITNSRNRMHRPENQGKERALRIKITEQAVKKSRVKWVEHENCIEQKRYSITPNDTYIMLFRQQDLPPETKYPTYEDIKKHFNNPFTTVPHKFGREERTINYVVEYNDTSRLYSIKFVENKVDFVNLYFIHHIITQVLSFILPESVFDISIFDFSCSKIKFLLLPDDTEAELISSQKTSQPYPATLVYETISPDKAKEINRRKSGELPWAEPGSPTPREVMSPFPLPKSPFSKPVSPSYLQWSHKPWGALSFADFSHGNGAAAEDPLSPARPANDILTVQVPHELVTFVDFGFEVIDKFYTPQRARSRSSSPTSGQGGSRQSSHRRTRRHPRVGKVSIRHGRRRRRRGTKGRTNTKRRNTKLR
jgi:hypothetical protein